MKHALAIFLAGALAASLSAQSIRVKVESKEVKFELPPMMTNGVTMVPLRSILDSMGGTMRWNLEKETVTIWRSNRRIDLLLNSRTAIVNNKTTTMEEAAFMHKGRIFIPLKFLAVAARYVSSNEKGFYVLREIAK